MIRHDMIWYIHLPPLPLLAAAVFRRVSIYALSMERFVGEGGVTWVVRVRTLFVHTSNSYHNGTLYMNIIYMCRPFFYCQINAHTHTCFCFFYGLVGVAGVEQGHHQGPDHHPYGHHGMHDLQRRALHEPCHPGMHIYEVCSQNPMCIHLIGDAACMIRACVVMKKKSPQRVRARKLREISEIEWFVLACSPTVRSTTLRFFT